MKGKNYKTIVSTAQMTELHRDFVLDFLIYISTDVSVIPRQQELVMLKKDTSYFILHPCKRMICFLGIISNTDINDTIKKLAEERSYYITYSPLTTYKSIDSWELLFKKEHSKRCNK